MIRLLAAAAALAALCAPAFAQQMPDVQHLPAADMPSPPAGLETWCTGQKTNRASDPAHQRCFVLKYNGLTIWAYNHADASKGAALAGFNGYGKLKLFEDLPGVRDVDNFVVLRNAKTVMSLGPGDKSATTEWRRLLAADAFTLGPSAVPEIPAGLKLVCPANGHQPDIKGGRCPLVRYDNHDSWALDYADKRDAAALVMFDPKRKFIRTLEVPGVHAVWKMTSDPYKRTVTITGKADHAATLPWSKFLP